MRVRWVLGVLLCLLPATPGAWADGRVFSGRPEPLHVPDQEAILCYRNGVETLAIRTRVDVPSTGGDRSGKPLAWVVPVPGPAAPTLSSTTPGTFVAADRLLSTRFVDRVDRSEGAVALVIGVAAVLSVLALRASKEPQLSSAARVVFLTVFFGGFVLFATCLTLPTLANARSAGEGWVAGGVRLLASQRVGTLDVSVLQATAETGSAPALRDWLTRQGCVVPQEADGVIRDYAAAGWVFVAARLSDEAAAGRLQPTPLVMTFKAPEPVYPMRLTGVGNGPLSLVLYVFAEGTAAAGGMTVEHSDQLIDTAEEVRAGNNWYRGVSHEGLRALFLTCADRDGEAWGTRLSGTLTPAVQQDDMRVSISPGVSRRRELYTTHAAANVGTAVGALLAGLALLALALWALIKARSARWILARSSVALAVAAVAGLAAAKCLPTLPGGFRYTKPAERNVRSLATALRKAGPQTEAQARAWIGARRTAGEWPWNEVAEENDGPDGWLLRTDPQGVIWLDVFDYRGGPAGSERLVESGTTPQPAK